MSKVTGPLMSLDARGTIGNALTFQTRRATSVVYKHNKPGDVNPFTPSASQLAQRVVIGNLVNAWQALSAYRKTDWDDLAKELGINGTGYHLYIKYNGVFPSTIDCLNFDGINDWVRTVNNPITQAQIAGGFTYECWAKFNTFDAIRQLPLDIGYRCMIGVSPTTNLLGFQWTATTGGNKYVNDTVALQLNTWYHFAATWDTTTLRLYKNGVSVGTPETADVCVIDSVARPFALGIQALDPPTTVYAFDGQEVEVRIWNKALNVADLLIHTGKLRDITSANTPSCSYASNCLIHYPMNVEKGVGATLTDVRSGKTGTFKAAGEPAWVKQRLFQDIYGI